MTTYRPDIDGLRAVAVLLVALFHLRLGVPGGYIGVDVFFVISGFLITGIVKRDIDRETFTLGAFYARRARRILPALFVVLLVSAVAATIVLLPSDLERFAKSALAAVLSLSNVWFWTQGGYFGFASEMAPLLHTWSLAVEEQFYLVFPIGMLVLHRCASGWLRPVLWLGFLGTFVASAWLVSSRPAEVFYFSPFRAWELLLGGLLALSAPPLIRSRVFRDVYATAGMCCIVGPAFVLTSESVFPGLAAALPCLGAALIIWVGAAGGSTVGNLLSSRPFVLVGLISYSFYLWHWPALVFVKHLAGEELQLITRLWVGLGSFALAVLTWRYVEIPFRAHGRVPNRLALRLAFVSLAVLTVFSGIAIGSLGLPDRYDAQTAALDRARARPTALRECIDIRAPISTATVCRIGAVGVATTFVWGDSYAHAMLPALDSTLKRLGVAGQFVSESGCPPLPSLSISYRGQDNWRCREFNSKVVEYLAARPELNRVVLVAAWDAYSSPSAGYLLRGKSADAISTVLKQGVESLERHLNIRGLQRNIIVMAQTPSYEWNVPYKMLRKHLFGDAIPPLRYEDWQSRSSITRGVFEQLAAASDGKIRFVNPSSWFCDSGACRYANERGEPLYWDGGHLNANGARFIEPFLVASLREALIFKSTQSEKD